MKTKLLAIGLIGAALAASAVFADDATSSTATPAMSGTASAPATDSNSAPAAPATQSGNGQVTAQ